MRLFIVLLFLVFTKSAFPQKVTGNIYLKMAMKNKPDSLPYNYNIDIYLVEGSKTYIRKWYFPNQDFLPLNLLCDTSQPVKLILDLTNVPWWSFQGWSKGKNYNGDNLFYAGDSVLYDLDKKTISVINRKK